MIYFITGNKNKFEEASKILEDLELLELDLPEIQEIDPRKIVEAKLLEAVKRKKGQFIVEDTSLHLDCLNGLPGPLIKWFLKTIRREGLAEIAAKADSQKAEAKALIGYFDGEKTHFFEGITKGEIVLPRGKTGFESGFGWDPIFLPEGHEKTFAEMTKEEKNNISHRRKAFDKFKEFLND